MTGSARLLRTAATLVALAVVGLACSDGGTSPGIPASLSVAPSDTTLVTGQSLQIAANVRDTYGNPLSPTGLAWTSSDPQVASVTASGLVSALAAGGPVTVTASYGSLSGSALVTVVPGTAAQLSIVTQPAASAGTGLPLSRQPVVQLRDAVGGAVPTAGVQVTAVLAEGQGTLANATATTNASGTATFTALSITGNGGTYRLRFQASGLSPATSDVIILSPITSLTVTTAPPATSQSGALLAPQPQVTVLTTGGAPLSGQSVTAAVASGGGTLAGTTTVATNGSGVAAFTDLRLSGPVGVHTLSFTAGPFTVESSPIQLESGGPASIVIVTQPSASALNGVAFGQQPIVEVRDDGSNPIAGVGLTVSVASGSGTLGGTTDATTNANGRVAFTDLSLTGPSGAYTLEFTSGSATIVSSTITLSVGSPGSIQIVTQPSSPAQSGVVFPQQPVVDVLDPGGNPVVGVVVTASIGSGGGTLGGTGTATTNGSGRATFAGLSISGLVGSRTLVFTSGAAANTSNVIQLQAGPLANLVMTTQPSANATNDVALPVQPAVTARDAAGNPISNVNVTASILSGGGTLGGTKTVATNGAGLATYSNLKITGTVGLRTLRFANAGVAVTSNQINVTAGPANTVSILVQPPTYAIVGVNFQQFSQVEVQDVSGNPVSGGSVLAAIANGGGSLSGTTTVATGASGVATFSNLQISGSPGVRTLRFSINGKEAISNAVNAGYAQGAYIDVQYCGSDPLQRMDVYVPSNSTVRPMPVAVYIHGGSWTGHDKSETDLLLWTNTRDELLSRGYVVTTLNYRLATPSTMWPAQIHDVKCAIRHLRAEAGKYGADGRIGVWGASAGGHLSAMIGVTDPTAAPELEGSLGYPGTSSRVDATVAIGGIYDLTQGPTHPDIQFIGGEATFASWPGPSAELNRASPIWWASGDDPPFLLVHGDQDMTVLYPQAPTMQAAGAPSTLVTVVNGGHELQDVGFGTPTPTIPQVMLQIADFFDTHVR